MSQEARAALAQLSDDALQTLILELGRYALSVSSRLYWRTGNAVDLPRGETVDSIVSKALTQVLSGERRWNPQAAPDLQKYRMGVIDSLLSHLAQHKDNTTLRAVPRPGALSISIRPPWASTRLRAIDRPSPLPGDAGER